MPQNWHHCYAIVVALAHHTTIPMNNGDVYVVYGALQANNKEYLLLYINCCGYTLWIYQQHGLDPANPGGPQMVMWLP
jgi:hypothetical protein